MSLPSQADVPLQLTTASAAWGKLRRLAAYAAFDGWTLAILGALTLVCGGYGSVVGVLLSLALLGTGIFEITTARRLRRLDPSSISHLALNQLVLACVLIVYSVVSLMQSRTAGGLPSEIEQALAQAGESPAGVSDQISAAAEILYTGVIAVALLVQGGTAFYYFSRKKYLQQYLEQTPPWIQQIQRDRGEVSI